MIDNYDPDTEPAESKQAEGHQHAIENLAKVRQRALTAVVTLNAETNSDNLPILPARGEQATAHSQANSIVITYANLVTKPRWIERHDAKEWVETKFTETLVPRALVDDEMQYATAQVESMANDSVDSHLQQIELEPMGLSLADVGDFSNQQIPIAKMPGSPYESHREPTVETRKLALPPDVLEEVFYRVDYLADYFGMLLEMEQSGVEADSSYAYVMDVANKFEQENAEELNE